MYLAHLNWQQAKRAFAKDDLVAIIPIGSTEQHGPVGPLGTDFLIPDYFAKHTSVYPVVRKKLVELQRQLAKSADVIMDGRDIGTCVLPDAQVKIYLTASSATRAKRRYDELTEKGVSCDLAEIEKDIIDRDYRDMHRETSPLRQAEDAVLVDSSEMNIDEVVDAIYQVYSEAR